MATVTKTIKRGDSRFYIHPETKDKRPGVTSVLNMLPKPFLKFWAAKLTAETAVNAIGELVGLTVKDPGGAVDWLKRAHLRNTESAAEKGTNAHNLFEKIARGQDIGRVHPDDEPWVRNIHEFNDQVQPEYLFLEEVVYSDTHNYAGSFDFIAKIEGETVMGDVKTTRSGVHAEVSLQLTAYSYAEYMILQDGSRTDIPKIDAGAVFWLRSNEWKVVPARIDDATFEYFCALRKVFDWDKTNGDSGLALGDPVFESNADASTGAERRANKR